MAGIQTPHRSSENDDDDVDASPWRRPAFLISAVVVVIVLAIGIVLIATNLTRNESPAPGTASTAQTPTDQTTGPAFPASICGLPGLETSGTVEKAPSATWSLVGTTAAPSSVGQAGPGVSSANGLRYCFAHTPEGAVFAAANFVALGSTPAIFDEVVKHSVAEGPGKSALLLAGPAASGDVRIQIMGFRLLNYDGGRTATVDVALRTSRGALAGQVYDLVWEDGDWRMRVTDQGELLTPAAQLTDLQGYIPWGGA